MMSELTRLRDEATRLLTVYIEHRDSQDETIRRKAHVDLDRFLMEHREEAAILFIQGLQDSINQLTTESLYKKQAALPWYKKLFGGNKHANSDTKVNKETVDNVG